jgi:hypothetical protein
MAVCEIWPALHPDIAAAPIKAPDASTASFAERRLEGELETRFSKRFTQSLLLGPRTQWRFDYAQ